MGDEIRYARMPFVAIVGHATAEIHSRRHTREDQEHAAYGEARALVLWAGKKCSPLDLSLLSTNSAVWFGRLPRQRHVADEVDRVGHLRGRGGEGKGTHRANEGDTAAVREDARPREGAWRDGAPGRSAPTFGGRGCGGSPA